MEAALAALTIFIAVGRPASRSAAEPLLRKGEPILPRLKVPSNSPSRVKGSRRSAERFRFMGSVRSAAQCPAPRSNRSADEMTCKINQQQGHWHFQTAGEFALKSFGASDTVRVNAGVTSNSPLLRAIHRFPMMDAEP